MPGRNCAFFGCPTSQKHKISLFQIPAVSAKQSEYTASIKKKTREEWLKIILRTREMTPELKTRIDNNNIYVCERHFKAECIQSDPDKPNSRKTLHVGSIPTEIIYLPLRSHESKKTSRRVVVRKGVEPTEDMPSTSSDIFEPEFCLSTSLTDLVSQLDTTVLLPWLTEIAQGILRILRILNVETHCYKL